MLFEFKPDTCLHVNNLVFFLLLNDTLHFRYIVGKLLKDVSEMLKNNQFKSLSVNFDNFFLWVKWRWFGHCPKSIVFIYYIIWLLLMWWIESNLATWLSSFVIGHERCLNRNSWTISPIVFCFNLVCEFGSK